MYKEEDKRAMNVLIKVLGKVCENAIGLSSTGLVRIYYSSDFCDNYDKLLASQRVE